MKKLLWCALIWSLSLAALRAQVTVEVQPDQDQYLPGEPINVAVRISNLSGQPLHLGADPNWLVFSVESKNGFLVSELQKLPVEGEFVLESSKVATKHVNITPGFELGRTGAYSVNATVNIKDWDKEISAKAKTFDVMQGAKLWEQTFGIPPSASHPNDPPEVRKYAIQQANYLKQLKLYVRISDADDSRIIKLFPVGSMNSFSRPEAQVDKFSNLHLFWQTGARTFAYRIINPDGDITGIQTHMYMADSRPRLAVDEAGKILVKGGIRQPSRDDLPASVTPTSTASTP